MDIMKSGKMKCVNVFLVSSNFLSKLDQEFVDEIVKYVISSNFPSLEIYSRRRDFQMHSM